jgi:hypothetical protein
MEKSVACRKSRLYWLEPGKPSSARKSWNITFLSLKRGEKQNLAFQSTTFSGGGDAFLIFFQSWGKIRKKHRREI